jgi:hypothetical protein
MQLRGDHDGRAPQHPAVPLRAAPTRRPYAPPLRAGSASTTHASSRLLRPQADEDPSPRWTSLAAPSPVMWQALHEHSRPRHGVVSLACARAVGLTPSTLASRAAREGWERLGPGAWLLPGAERTAAARAAAAVLTVPGSVVTGWSAAALHGLVRTPPTRIETIRPTGVADVDRAQVRGRRTRRLPPEDVTEIDGIPVVTVPRLLRDLSRSTSPNALRDLAIDGRRQTPGLLADLDALLRRHPRFPGRPALRSILEDLADDGSDSGFEHRLVERLGARSLAPDAQQILVETPAGRRYLDVGWHGSRVAIECLGFAFHSNAEQLRRDVHRQNAIAAVDRWLVLQLTWEMFHREWDTFEDLLRRCLRGRG